MSLSNNGGAFGAQAYGQGATGPGQQLTPQQQLQNKVTLANSLPPFHNELKGHAVTNVPNMVSSCYGYFHIIHQSASTTLNERCRFSFTFDKI